MEIQVLNSNHFSNKDIKQFTSLGLTLQKIKTQLKKLKNPSHYLTLNRPATINDGIKTISQDRAKQLISIFDNARPEKDIIKFVPASGAASRMFKTLLKYNKQANEISTSNSVNSFKEDYIDKELQLFFDKIRDFAFFDALTINLKNDGFDIETLIKNKEFDKIIEYLLLKKGLGYGLKPKGLINFHKYTDGNRTSFEEHLVEAANFISNDENKCSLHFTVSLEHKKSFVQLFRKIKKQYENRLNIHFDITFSVQEEFTSTIAVDDTGKPFRLSNGDILFRPSGHGALIENLARIDADIIFIKNIDNVVLDKNKKETYYWKKVLGGYLIDIQQKIFNFLNELFKPEIDEKLIEISMKFANDELNICIPDKIKLASMQEKKDFLISKFNRPLRVCGMVKNTGESGGGPFWVEDKNGKESLQIVESSQINLVSKNQRSILHSSTHFNPVDIVCGVRDWRKIPFNLKEYIDNEAVIITKKSEKGVELNTLELPGLWNGAMAYWNTIFIEVPLITFNPVKTINDLLRKEHQL